METSPKKNELIANSKCCHAPANVYFNGWISYPICSNCNLPCETTLEQRKVNPIVKAVYEQRFTTQKYEDSNLYHTHWRETDKIITATTSTCDKKWRNDIEITRDSIIQRLHSIVIPNKKLNESIVREEIQALLSPEVKDEVRRKGDTALIITAQDKTLSPKAEDRS